MDINMDSFQQRLRKAISASHYNGNLRKLSLEADCGEKWLSNLLNSKQIGESKVGPGFFAMSRIAALLNCGLDHLAGQDTVFPTQSSPQKISHLLKLTADLASRDEAITASNPQSILRKYAKSGGRIGGFVNQLDQCDIYFPAQPGDKTLKVEALGKNSLSAVTMETSEVSALQSALNHIAGTKVLNDTIADHIEAVQRGAFTTIKSLDQQMGNLPIRVKMDYLATFLHVEMENGEHRTLSFCSLLI